MQAIQKYPSPRRSGTIRRAVRSVFSTSWNLAMVLGISFVLGACAAVAYRGFLLVAP